MGVDGFWYTTIAGDTYDILALDVYNDEMLAGGLIKANPDYSGVLVFDAGVRLWIPYVEERAPATLPPWRR